MQVNLNSGTYIVAVSGGVDSMVLLDVLQKQYARNNTSQVQLIVAHYNHGIREDANEDRMLVQAAADVYGIEFVYDEVHLGNNVSEAVARECRYKFLKNVQRVYIAQAIITAHHQDDLIETAIINMIRGTGRRGLTALQSHQNLVRPLLNIPKDALRSYAIANQLSWREDSTNKDDRYLRNYIRLHIVSRFSNSDRASFLEILRKLQTTNSQLDILLDNQLHIQSVGGMIDRQWFNQLPHNVAREIMATWLRSQGETNFNSKMLERLVVAAKVAHAGSGFSISKTHSLGVQKGLLALNVLER
jgi:tRNA(Ile)-lysidine synthetase-like protein